VHNARSRDDRIELKPMQWRKERIDTPLMDVAEPSKSGIPLGWGGNDLFPRALSLLMVSIFAS
jgi:hypothetical protein